MSKNSIDSSMLKSCEKTGLKEKRKTTPKMIDGKPTDRYKINMIPEICSYDHYDLRKMDRICKRMVTEAVKRYVRDHSW